MILQSLSTPMLPEPLWALIPGLVAVVVIVVPANLEDRFLQTELPGLREHVGQVCYCLVPGMW